MRIIPIIAAVSAAFIGGTLTLQAQTYTNFIRQTQYPTGVIWDAGVTSAGTRLSPLGIDSGGAKFELWTVKSSPLANYLLDSKFVGSYIPLAWCYLVTEDSYNTIPRTRADRPFTVYINIAGLLGGASDPIPSKSVNLLRHVQSYGSGDGTNINRNLATLHTQTSITKNGWQIVNVNLSAVPGADRSKIRGEERFSVFSLADYQAPALQLASQFVQIWPVASGSVVGLANGDLVQAAMPKVTVTLNDLYPDSRVYAKVYEGTQNINEPGTIVPGSAIILNEAVPQTRTLSLDDWDNVVAENGTWTVDVMTTTPFGTDRLATVTFEVDRTITVKASVTSLD